VKWEHTFGRSHRNTIPLQGGRETQSQSSRD